MNLRMDPIVFTRFIEQSLSDQEHYDHPFSRALKADGFQLSEKRHAEDRGALFMGLCFQRGNTEFVYRFPNPESLIIANYRLIRKHAGLINPFRDLIWFVEFLKNRKTGMRRVLGTVRQMAPEGLTAERIGLFYSRYFEVFIVKDKYDQDWVFLDLEVYRPLRSSRRRSPRR